MVDLASFMGGALLDVGDAPGSVAALIGDVGAQESVRVLSGLERAPKAPRKGEAASAEYTRWRTAQRRVQRARADKPRGGQQSRGQVKPAPLSGAAKDRWRGKAEDKRLSDLLKHGGRLRITARVRVPTPGVGRADVRTRTMPSGGPGVYVEAEVLDQVIAAAEDGDDARAEGLLMDAFAEGYGVDIELFEFEEVDSMELKPD